MTTDKPGTIVTVNKQAILVATGEGVLEIREIQTANSKRMSVGQFLAGHRVTTGVQLGSSTA
jgi:methionyl-tRNA formyltransferase